MGDVFSEPAVFDHAGISNQVLSDEVQTKFHLLRALLRPKLDAGLLVAFSGGVDSAFLAFAAESVRRDSGGKLLALTTLSESFSQAERRDADEFVRAHRIEHVWHRSDELANPAYAINDLNRCFHCKSELFAICRRVANERGFEWIAYGYNASDRGDVRPGHRAALENGILSPLADAKMTKDDIRSLMRHFEVELADKPASPCLSSRIMTGVAITPRKLRDVEELEAILREGGLRVFRVRLHEDGEIRYVRLEVASDELDKAIELRDQFTAEALRRGFKWAMLDLAGYRTGGGNIAAK
ncbi:MAG: ATP-dependent sacrificial sulfur transferase LarE [Pyrinomonadaceae bacterium]